MSLKQQSALSCPDEVRGIFLSGSGRMDGIDLWIYGGPFWDFPDGPDWIGVNLKAEETDARADIWFPIRDFCVPEQDRSEVSTLLSDILISAHSGKMVYVGCMGGTGRTGMVLALLTKAMGHHDPVEFVRTHYKSGAVEVSKQEMYVRGFDTTETVDSVLMYVDLVREDTIREKVGLWARIVGFFRRIFSLRGE